MTSKHFLALVASATVFCPLDTAGKCGYQVQVVQFTPTDTIWHPWIWYQINTITINEGDILMIHGSYMNYQQGVCGPYAGTTNWYKDGELIESLEDAWAFTEHVTEEGTYTATVTGMMSNTWRINVIPNPIIDADQFFLPDDPVQIDPERPMNGVHMEQGLLTVSWSYLDQEPLVIQLWSLDGRQVLAVEARIDATSATSLKIPFLNDGVYLCRLRQGDHIFSTRQFISR